ncbi:MAG: nuclear transport factor 2 family protein [Desulfatitalea sp.]|nr:nuclear transport factor 2 family protein [Desulfatitalea sp.]
MAKPCFKTKVEPMMTHTDIVREYLICWGKRDMAAARKYLSETCSFSDPFSPKRLSTEEFLESAKSFISSIKAMNIISIAENGDWVGAYYSVKTGLVPEMVFSEWFRIEDGKIKEGNLIYDTHAIRTAIRKLNRPD